MSLFTEITVNSDKILEKKDQLFYICPAIANNGKKKEDPNKKSKPSFLVEPYRSEEEVFFSWYLEELKHLDYIDFWEYNAETFLLSDSEKISCKKELKTKDTVVERSLLDSHYYTPDFRIVWNKKASGLFFINIDCCPKLAMWDVAPFKAQFRYVSGEYKEVSTVEIKPSHDFKNMEKLAKLNIQWVFQNYGIYVQIIKPVGGAKEKDCLFKKTFTPIKYFKTPTGKDRVQNYAFKILSEII